MVLAYSDAYGCEPNSLVLQRSSRLSSLLSPFPSPVPICIHPALFLALVQMCFGLSCGLIYPLTQQADNYISADLVFS